MSLQHNRTFPTKSTSLLISSFLWCLLTYNLLLFSSSPPPSLPLNCLAESKSCFLSEFDLSLFSFMWIPTESIIIIGPLIIVQDKLRIAVSYFFGVVLITTKKLDTKYLIHVKQFSFTFLKLTIAHFSKKSFKDIKLEEWPPVSRYQYNRKLVANH